MWESPCADRLPSTIPCLLGSSFPRRVGGERCFPWKSACLVAGRQHFCRPSSDTCLCIPPPGLVGLLHFYPFSIPFPGLFLLSLVFLGKRTVTSCAVCKFSRSKILQIQQEQDGPERVRGALKPSDLPAGFLWVSGADLFPSLLRTFPHCSFMACSATEEPSACDPRTGFLQTCALASCKRKLPAMTTAGAGVVFFGVGFQRFFNHRLMPSKTGELVFAAAFSGAA